MSSFPPVLVSLWMWIATAASASTVAVLDLDRAAGGETYDGLGRALSGMLVSDLAQAPGLTLVERSRLDAVLSEIDLASTAFIDPATAQKLGKGLSAEYLVVGSYSVVGGTFLLDARVVGAESGTVVRAARADGGVDGFVDVEKALVADLLDGLGVLLAKETLARIGASVPTRSFDAFTAYGAAVTYRDEGRIEEAREALAAALKADPGFDAPRTALGDLGRELDRRRLEQVRAAQKAQAAKWDAAVAAYPPPKGANDLGALAGFAVRLEALQHQGQHCQRYDEMRAFLDAAGWKFPPPKYDFKKFWEDVVAHAVSVGYAPKESVDGGGYAEARFELSNEVALFSSIPGFFYAFPQNDLGVASAPDLLTSLVACRGVEGAVPEIEVLAEEVRRRKLDGAVTQPSPQPLGERFEWTTIALRAQVEGVDAAMAARIQALLDLHPDGDLSSSLQAQAKDIFRAGVGVETSRIAKLGFRDAELTSVLEGVAGLDPARVAVDDPDCAPILQLLTWRAKGEAAKPLQSYTAATYAPLRDLGCLVGFPGRFATPPDAFGWLTTVSERKRADPPDPERCTEAFAKLPEMLFPPSFGGPPPPQDARRAADVLTWYYSNLETALCVTPTF